MKQISRDNYFTIQGFMRTELKLKGNELLVYAIIYGFSQKKEQVFHGSIPYLAEFTGASQKTVSRALQSLVDSGLIIKGRFEIDGIERITYRASKKQDTAKDDKLSEAIASYYV